MSFADHVRRINPRLWFFFKFHRYRYLKGEREIGLLHRIVPSSRIAIDVGASIGLYSRTLARLAPKVFAFEANPAVAAFARRVAPRNVEVINVALSSESGRTSLRVPINRRGNTTDDLATIETKNDLAGLQCAMVEVPTKRLDDYGFADCGFMKIDVEGHEEAVLDGAMRLIETRRPILMIELEERHNSGTIERVTAKLSRLSYDGYFVLGREFVPIAQFRPHLHQNVAAVLALPPHQRRRAQYIVNFIFVPHETVSSVRAPSAGQ